MDQGITWWMIYTAPLAPCVKSQSDDGSSVACQNVMAVIAVQGKVEVLLDMDIKQWFSTE